MSVVATSLLVTGSRHCMGRLGGAALGPGLGCHTLQLGCVVLTLVLLAALQVLQWSEGSRGHT